MLEILAKIKGLGAISPDRKQTIELSEVGVMKGEFCQGETRHIVFLNSKESEKFINLFYKKQKKQKKRD